MTGVAATTKNEGGSDRLSGPEGRARVLVAYASEHGSTRGVAERLAAKLGESGDRVELCPVAQVDRVTAYDAVVFGSAVYNGDWLPEAQEFVRENLGALADRAVWLFSVGTFGDRKRIIGPLMRKEPRGIRDLEQAIHPRDYRVFAGVIDRHQWPLYARLFLRVFGGRLGDNRNWDDIEAWAEGIARVLRTPAAGQLR